MSQRIKVAITGAAGQIGYALLFRIASGQMFGPNTDVELQLLELTPALSALRGVAMELEDCAFPLLKKIVCTDDVNVAMQDANWVLLVGAVPRKAGMERGDLLQINGKIFTAQGKAINDHAAADVRVLVIGNPCNTNALIAMHHAPKVPRNRFYAMTMLDENRARAQLAQKAGVDITAIHHMIIWGNHSATQFPDFMHATINGKPATDIITDHQWLQSDFISTVQKRGAAVIEARGLSSAASAANAIVHSVYSLTHPTPAHETFSMALCSDGQYGVDDGLIFSFPCICKADGTLQVVEGIEHDAFAQAKMQATLDELRSEYHAVKELGLI